MSSIGKKIRKIRELKNFTQEYMAFSLNISQKAYSKIENGNTALTYERLMQITRILDISEQSIVSFDETTIFTKEENNVTNERSNNIQTSLETEKLLEETEKLKAVITLLLKLNK